MNSLTKLPFVLQGDITDADQQVIFLIPGGVPLSGYSTISMQSQDMGNLNRTSLELYDNITTLSYNQNLMKQAIDELQLTNLPGKDFCSYV